MLSSIRHLKGYGVAVVAVAIAFLLTQLVWGLIQPHLYPLFLAAVMVSSWYGGIGPGLLATVLAAVLCNHFFVPPLYSSLPGRDGIVGLIQFGLVAGFISFLNSRLRSTQHRAERNAREAEQNYEFLRQSQENLRRSEERYRILVEGVTEYAIFMLDPNGIFASWNVGSERMLGYSEAEIIGQPFARIFTSEAIQQGLPAQVLQMAIAEGFSRENRWHIRKDGTYIWTHCIITVLRNENGNLRGFAKIMQDITQRKLAEEEREELLVREQAARAEAEAANRAKDDFLAVVSHELRTPMTAIVGWAGMLRSGMLDDNRAALAVETIERNANLQMQLIEDLLDISRIVRGDISLNFARVDLARVITAAIEVVQPAANEKAIDLEFVRESAKRAEGAEEAEEAEGETSHSPLTTHHSPLIWGDSERLQQVVWNLLSNAIKFTPEGGRVEVRLEKVKSLPSNEVKGQKLALERSEGLNVKNLAQDQLPITNYQLPVTNFAQIQVIDTGVGIDRDFLPYVFDRFRQADSTSARSNKGLGLGLAIARHLVELHNGTIRVDSSGRGQGTTFTIELPVSERVSRAGETGEENPSAPSLQPPAPSLRGLRVLVVDDEADARQWITVVLEESGAEVIAVASVGKALEVIEQHRPDVLISDIGMPGEDGYTLIRKIRELEPQMGGTIPAVALTGYARQEDYTKALAEGFQLHVAKPIRAAELVAVVTSLAKMAGKL
ncbi:MAG: Sensor histidine kinase TmoS [Chroococcidiopsis cubana SAG 39.79]|uniref:hybrid sensor histidine kinase/response regulator n=2 Tax=Chroococcidiopsis cubana TaxID=171392 RepID=UPI002AC62935|nr:ATP-binding protein [Chroococcidiopsis cubana]MDZ4870920.1 Sensor histidine kinase TmoS [Chroococcidiopsis cubana SAG 39.79]